MSFIPKRDFVIKLHEWVCNNFGRKFVLSLETAPELLGGCVLSYGGRYFDLSLKKKIDEYFSNKVAL